MLPRHFNRLIHQLLVFKVSRVEERMSRPSTRKTGINGIYYMVL